MSTWVETTFFGTQVYAVSVLNILLAQIHILQRYPKAYA
jgi:hypothetical protein